MYSLKKDLLPSRSSDPDDVPLLRDEHSASNEHDDFHSISIEMTAGYSKFTQNTI